MCLRMVVLLLSVWLGGFAAVQAAPVPDSNGTGGGISDMGNIKGSPSNTRSRNAFHEHLPSSLRARVDAMQALNPAAADRALEELKKVSLHDAERIRITNDGMLYIMEDMFPPPTPLQRRALRRERTRRMTSGEPPTSFAANGESKK